MPHDRNIPLDSHILVDTDHLRDYLNEMPDIALDQVEEGAGKDSLKGVIADPLDPTFGALVETLVDMATEDNALRDATASALHESDVWERVSDICDDVLVQFVRDSIKEAKRHIPNETLYRCTLAYLVDSLAQGDETSINIALARASALTEGLTTTDRALSVHSIVSDTDCGRLVIIETQTEPEDE